MRPNRLLLPLFCLLTACSNPGANSNAQPLPGPPLREPAPREVPLSAGAVRLSFAPVVKRAAPAVVNVYSRRVERQILDPFWQMFAPRERIAQSLGSGVIVRADGVIVTNNHVVEGGQEIMVVLGDRREFPAKVLLADKRADIAVLKIEAAGLPVLALNDRDDAQVGDLVLAIGDPFGVGQTVTNGIVSALARSGVGITDFSYFIQTDAAINPGNSGGALVDMNGDMIGMNTAIVSQSGGSSGVGFAIPAALVKRVVETAVGGGVKAARPWLGLKTQAVTGEIAKSMGLDRPEGVLVTDVYPDSPAARAGLKTGDLILAIDALPVNDEATLNYRVATRRAGDAVALKVRRGKGPVQTLSVRIAPPPGAPTPASQTIDGANPLSGATVIELSPAAAEQLGVDVFAAHDGVMIAKLSDGYAARLGLQPGDVIVAVNGRKIVSIAELREALKAANRGWAITIQRGDQTETLRVRL